MLIKDTDTGSIHEVESPVYWALPEDVRQHVVVNIPPGSDTWIHLDRFQLSDEQSDWTAAAYAHQEDK